MTCEICQESAFVSKPYDQGDYTVNIEGDEVNVCWSHKETIEGLLGE